MSAARRRLRTASPLPALAPLLLGLALLSLATGCSDSTGPAGDRPDRGRQGWQAELNPGGGTFVLQKIDLPEPGPGAIELVGTGLVTDSRTETVEVTVALRNASDRPLHAPATLWLSALRPPEVEVLNPDLTRCLDFVPPGEPPPPGLPCQWGFEYGQLFGEDEVLAPGELSGGKLWRFHVPGLASFAFRADAVFGLEPGLPRLGGLIWHDLNGDGRRQPEEPPLPAGMVEVQPPEGPPVTVHPDELGRWAVPVEFPGLHRATYLPPPVMGPLPPRVTTPNPLEVLLTPAAPGEPPRGFLEADFGVLLNAPPPGPPPLLLTEAPPDSLHRAPFLLQAHELAGRVLRLRVGFSGCQPRHPFALFMSGGFRESEPPQAVLVLQHDGLGEMCDAFFTADLAFDLAPMIRLYLAQGGGPGPIEVRLLGPDGEVARFRVPVEVDPR